MQISQINEPAVLEALRTVVDPELNCNIVDLGLIYDIRINGGKVVVTMTLTTAGCPMHESIALGVQRGVLSLEEVEEAEVILVWDPPWHFSMASDYGRACLGIV